MVEPPGEPPKESPKGMGLWSGDSCTLIQKWAGPGGECSLHFEKSPAEEASAVGSSFCRKLLLKEVPSEGNPFQGKSLVQGESRLRRCRPAGLVRRAVETLYPPWSYPSARAHWHSEGCSLGRRGCLPEKEGSSNETQLSVSSRLPQARHCVHSEAPLQ